MNKPTKKPLIPQDINANESNNRINIFNKGYNQACDDWEIWLISQKNEKPSIVKSIEIEETTTQNKGKNDENYRIRSRSDQTRREEKTS
jgi:hypothetical protein